MLVLMNSMCAQLLVTECYRGLDLVLHSGIRSPNLEFTEALKPLKARIRSGTLGNECFRLKWQTA